MSLDLEATVLPALGEGGRFAAANVRVSAERILRIQGYHDLARVRPRIRAAAEYAAGLVGEVADGEVGFRHLAVTRLGEGVLELGARHPFQCDAFDRFLGGCPSVVLFVLTAGAQFDARIDELMRTDRPVEGLFLDSAGWLAVESVTRQFAERLRSDAAEQGLRLTRRMGPGYSFRIGTRMEPWGLEEQRELFAALGDAPLPAQLLDSAAMRPKMSRSGLFGLRAAGTAGTEPSPNH